MDRDHLTTSDDVPAPRTVLRRIAPVGIVLVFVIVGALAALLFVQSQPEAWVGWGSPGFYPATAQTATVVMVTVGVPTCIYWDAGRPRGDTSWLAPAAVTYTPSAVTITLRTSDAFDAVCSETLNGRRVIGYILDVYASVRVPLTEPLGGRALFDGSTTPPAARPYH